jgi:alpha,alpha-trehalase
MASMYANLASGAESGWDYGTRWLARPGDAVKDIYFPLRSLNVANIVPVDLNSILYANEVTIGRFLKMTGNAATAADWASLARKRSEAMYALMWNNTLWSYFDYNLTSSAQNIYVPVGDNPADTAGAPPGYQVLFDVAQLYPFWTGAAPKHLKNNPLAVKRAFGPVSKMLGERAGGIPATNLQTGQQWDEPNVWPPLMYILMQGLLNTPATFGRQDPDWTDLQDLALKLAQRYVDSTFCTWYATGGQTSATPKLQGLGPDAVGIMFEKYADNATNVAGSGGEYSVVEGFGWTNGVLMWATDTFAKGLKRPDCGNITAAHVIPGKRSLARRAVELHPWDAAWIKKFGRMAP